MYKGFTSVKLTSPQRSQFDLSHFKRLSTRAGRLTPVFITECVPSDKFYGSSEILVRVAPLLAPIYDQLILTVHYFFVPNRILYIDWEELITGGRLGVGIDPVDAPVPPFVDLGQLLDDSPEVVAASSLGDYLGVPSFTELPGYSLPPYNGVAMDILPFLAYQRCFYDWYRDRNFVSDDSMEFPVAGGVHLSTEPWFTLQDRAWSHDYFTSALPFTQRGEEVLMPLAGSGSVTYLDTSLVQRTDGAPPPGAASWLTSGAGVPGDLIFANAGGPVVDSQSRIENIDQVILDASSVSINDFRSAYALQVWYERNAVAGSRYTESNLAHFNVRSQDSRLQRAEYIGGGRIPIKISEIVSTAWSEDPLSSSVVPLANLAGHGITYGNTNQFNYFCPEHGFIIGIASISSPPSYNRQGLPRMFRRRSVLDYPWPTFAKLGEQAIDRAELFASGAMLTPDADGNLPIFGYTSRYADWKFIASTNHGAFAQDLLFWSLARNFGSAPVLGNAFIKYDVDLQQRIFAVNNSSDNFWLYIHNDVRVLRPLPYFGTPNTLGFV